MRKMDGFLERLVPIRKRVRAMGSMGVGRRWEKDDAIKYVERHYISATIEIYCSLG